MLPSVLTKPSVDKIFPSVSLKILLEIAKCPDVTVG